mgnify:CR=1 FL=1
MNLNPSELEHFFKLANRICRENKLKEFQFKFLHRIIATRGKNYVALVLNKIVTVCIAEMKTLSSIPVSIINSQKHFCEESVSDLMTHYSNLYPSVKGILFGLLSFSPILKKALSCKTN